MKTLLLLSLVSSVAWAPKTFADEAKPSTYSVFQAHDHFSLLNLNGDSAKKMYERLQVRETEIKSGMGERLGSFSKVSVDGRMACSRIPQDAERYIPQVRGTYECQITLDTSSGEIGQTWKGSVSK